MRNKNGVYIKIYKIRLTEKGKNIFTEIRPYLVNLRDETVRGIKKEDLEKVVQDLSAKVYQQAQEQAQQAQGEQGQAQDDNVEDADFTEVNDDDKQK